MIDRENSWSRIVPSQPVHAPPLVYVHGFGCSRVVWQELSDSLGDDREQILLDLPGHGAAGKHTWQADRHATLDGMAGFVREIMIESIGDAPAVLIGHSIGCNIAWRVAIASPDAVTGLVLINPSPCFLNKPGYQGGFDQETIDELLELMERNPPAWAANLAGLVAGGVERVGDWLAGSFCAVEPDCLHVFARATFLVDDRDLLPHIRQPSLILSNAKDVLVPPAAHEAMSAGIPAAKTHMLDIGGHAAHLTHPFLVAERVRDFLR